MKLNKTIDHTILQADATKDLVIQTIDEAKAFDTASICLEPCWVKLAAERLADSDVKVCTVIGFPLGATTSATKAFEANEAVENGADEVDMVLNIGALKSGEEEMVLEDMKAVRRAVPSAVVKVILETCLLTDEEKQTACRLAKESRPRLCKDLHRFQYRRCDGRRCEVNARSCRRGNGRKSKRRYSYERNGGSHDRSRRHQNRRIQNGSYFRRIE